MKTVREPRAHFVRAVPYRWAAGFLEAAALGALCAAPAIADTITVAPGGSASDLMFTPPGFSSVTLPGLPINFFGGNSDAIPAGTLVDLMGIPLEGTPPMGPATGYGIPGQSDTIVRRLAPAAVNCGGPPVTIPIEILALNLVSVNPITVTFNGGTNPTPYEVRVSISQTGPQPMGSMTITHTNFDGGVFTSTLPVRARLIFTRFAPGAPGVPSATIDPENVVLQPPPGSMNFWSHTGAGLPVMNSPGGIVDHDADPTTPMINYPPTTNFVVGVATSGGTCTAPGEPQKHLSQEQEMLAKHGILPPNRPPVQHFGFGDGSNVPCPCGNNSPPGSGRGCLHSLSNPAIGGALEWVTGNGSLADDGAGGFESIMLRARDMKQPSTCIFLQGNALIVRTPFGDGLRVVAGMLLRLGVKNVIVGKASYGALIGDQPVSTRSAALGDVIAPGQFRYYQVYYRDPVPVFCPPDTFNITQAVAISYGP